MDRNIKRGDIYIADLDPVVGSEQNGKRPVLVISNDTGNKYSPTVIIAAMTSLEHTKHNMPTHIKLKRQQNLSKDSIVLLEQIRTLDKRRLKEYVGTIDSGFMSNINDAIAVSVSINQNK